VGFFGANRCDKKKKPTIKSLLYLHTSVHKLAWAWCFSKERRSKDEGPVNILHLPGFCGFTTKYFGNDMHAKKYASFNTKLFSFISRPPLLSSSPCFFFSLPHMTYFKAFAAKVGSPKLASWMRLL